MTLELMPEALSTFANTTAQQFITPPNYKKSTTGQVCSRCIYDESTPSIVFDAQGVCNYCNLHDVMDAQYPTGAKGHEILMAQVAQMKERGKNNAFDCVIGVSGGCDSSYLVWQLKQWGLRPLAAHFDNTWNSPIATQNIYKVLNKLDVELFTIVADSREYNDICRAFMLSGVKDIEAPTDIALAATCYKAAEKYNIPYIINGHSFRTEGVSPHGWIYFDGQYVKSVHKQYGTMPLKTYPNLDLFNFIKWTAFSGIAQLRPLYHLDYDKEATKKFLAQEFGWEWYGGHHLENRFTAFYHSYFIPRRTSYDMRMLGFAACTRSGQMTRDEALAEMAKPPQCEADVIQLVKTRLGFSDEEFERVLDLPLVPYTEFKTYKPFFEKARPFFWLMYKLDRVPKSFYLKYCFPGSQGVNKPAG
ncbi:MAG: N-acetyl sugar amidotransferase [Vampirovibrionales bacterium]|nr:N-acetyl sugar amidotransferase [Vampirovibrionales bacterium]